MRRVYILFWVTEFSDGTTWEQRSIENRSSGQRRNVKRNGFEKHIELRLVNEDDDLVSERDAKK